MREERWEKKLTQGAVRLTAPILAGRNSSTAVETKKTGEDQVHAGFGHTRILEDISGRSWSTRLTRQ